MGAWSELDTEISITNDLSDLNAILNIDDEYGIFDAFKESAKELKRSIETGSKNAVQTLAELDVDRQEYWINKNCKNPSGMLASSIDISGGDYSFTIGTRINDVYPMSIEYGHRDIYPVRAKALAFYYKGSLIFRKHVKSTKPRSFVAPAYNDINKVAEELTIRELAHAGIKWD